MIGRILYTLVIVAIVALVVTIGFQVYSLLTVEQPGVAAPAIEAATAVEALASPDLKQAAPAAPQPVAVAEKAPAAQPAVAGPKPGPETGKAAVSAPVATQPAPDATKTAGPAVSDQRVAIGKADYVAGAVSVINAGAESRTLAVGTEVYLNDKLVCGKEAKAKIALNDGTVIWVGETSEVLLDRYVFSGDRTKAECILRFIKGACHVVTGAITSLNPDGFKLRARMATVGIRGCEVGVRGDDLKQDVYVIEVGAKETILVEAAEDGSAIMNPETGEAIKTSGSPLKTLNVSEAGVTVSIEAGKGVQMRRTDSNEIRTFMRDTSSLSPARYDLQQRPDGAVVVVQPGAEESPEPQE